MVPWADESKAGTLLRVWVVPGASRTSIDGTHGDALKVRVAAPPERGRANRALIEHLEAVLGTSVTIESGSGGRLKIVEVAALPPESVAERLSG